MGEVAKFFVFGFPLPKGSGSAIVRGGKARGYLDQSDKATKTRKSGGLKRWQSAVRERARNEMVSKIQGPICLDIDFYLERPRKPKFSIPASKPDVDKLCRAVCDALSGIAYDDDSRIVRLVASKNYVSGIEPTGAFIIVKAYDLDAC